MDKLITECYELLKGNGFDFAFCGGHALDIFLSRKTRPHGDIDLSAYWDERDRIIDYMKSIGWTVYEACGGGMIHLINDTKDQMLKKTNIFCVKDGCQFFHTVHDENDMYRCEIDHVEQTELDFIEFLFNNRENGEFIYSRNDTVRMPVDKAILCKDGIQYFSPELVLLYKSTDLNRIENAKDFETFLPCLTYEGTHWLVAALKTANPCGHAWIAKLSKKHELWDVLDGNGNKTGRFHERGKPMQAEDYHLVVHVWIMNSNGEFLISKRTPFIDWPNMWQTTGGSAVAGDDSLETALKESAEEIGVRLNPKNGQLFKRYKNDDKIDRDTSIYDIWLFRHDANITDITLQPEETCDAMWADRNKIIQMIDDGLFIPRDAYPYLDELFYFCDKPFWEIGYSNMNVSTFAKGPTNDLAEFAQNFVSRSRILDVGCGEGRNALFLAEHGHILDAFDLSEAGIKKASAIAEHKGLDANFFVSDLGDFKFNDDYDVILSHGVLHLPEKETRDRFIADAQNHTKKGGYNLIGVFTNRLPATPDNAPFTKSLFDVGELPEKYTGWKILSHDESTFHDSHPGGVSHEHAYERIIAQKI